MQTSLKLNFTIMCKVEMGPLCLRSFVVILLLHKVFGKMI